MCEHCGCTSDNEESLHRRMHEQGIPHEHEHRLTVEQNILSLNNSRAEENRSYFARRGICAVNMVSSPGAGKTSLLEQTLLSLSRDIPVAVIEGDQHTDNDTRRIEATGVPCLQINTAQGCHLDADMVHHALLSLDLEERSLLFIENVGNLVCPAMFDLGESLRVVVISITEGDDKPLKYPYIFESAQVCVIRKIDLLPYLKCDVERLRANLLQVNPSLRIFEISSQSGEGLLVWRRFWEEQIPEAGQENEMAG